MDWNYRGVLIKITTEGMFTFACRGRIYSLPTLDSAKGKIDECLQDNSYFSPRDIRNLMDKLDDREKQFVAELIFELKKHDVSVDFYYVLD